MRKLLSLLVFASLILLTGCNQEDINDLNSKYELLSQEQQALKEEQELQAALLKNYETLLNALQNKLTVDSVEDNVDGYTIIFSDGSTVDLTNGHTPVFSLADNGNWLIDGKDSGIKATGENGLDGQTPEITIVEGYWYINGENTGVKAEATDGTNGNNGADGNDGENAPSITGIVVEDGNMIFKFSNDTQITVPMEETATIEYTSGLFIVNEGWFGQETGSVNFFRNGSNDIETKVFANANPGSTLGNTTQYAAIYNQQLYIISKQGALVVADAKTMKETGRIDNFNKLASDGRAFCGVTADLGLVSTANGIYKLNLNPLSLGDKIDGITGEVGELLQYRQYVFAVAKGKIYVINTDTWAIDKTYDGAKGGLAVSKDGMVWSANGNSLLKINPYTLEMETIAMPTGVSVSHNAWVWTASSLSASKQENALYFVNGLKVYKYVIGDPNSLNSPLFTVPSGRMIYGAGINVDPRNNQVVVTTIDGWGTSAAKNNLYFYDGTTGALKKNIFYEHYWFPAIIVFT
ncbi:DUF5074 domain-containing protein [Arenibacter sp. 6A1]|uniref:DUF5074 domain-containing protein n=1 Tax=Arenibacter sp. 6A1 TaxID=2720391 RepID=UPI0014485093|nr:DUF5074 domain-containing protein [Arenibacter sp. 6A1]NKI26402.1 DUF5074 domain-containing protein [Arenibacter sp. 6A1]